MLRFPQGLQSFRIIVVKNQLHPTLAVLVKTAVLHGKVFRRKNDTLTASAPPPPTMTPTLKRIRVNGFNTQPTSSDANPDNEHAEKKQACESVRIGQVSSRHEPTFALATKPFQTYGHAVSQWWCYSTRRQILKFYADVNT